MLNKKLPHQISATYVLKVLRIDIDRCDSIILALHAILLLRVALVSSNAIRQEKADQTDEALVDRVSVPQSCLSRSNSSFTDTDTTVPVHSHDDSFGSTSTIWLVAEEGLAHGSTTFTTTLQGVMSYLWGANEERHLRHLSHATTSENSPAAACPVILQTTEEPMYSHEHSQNETCATTLLLSLFHDEKEAETEQQPREWSVNNIPPWSALHTNAVDEMY